MLPELEFIQKIGSNGETAQCVVTAAGLVAFSADGKPKLIRCDATPVKPEIILEGKDIHCTSLGLSDRGRTAVLGTAEGEVLIVGLTTNTCARLDVAHVDGVQPTDSVRCIAGGRDDDTFAVSIGSYVIIAHDDGSIRGTHGPIASDVTELRWIKDCLVALTLRTCHIWPDVGSGSEIVLTSVDGNFVQLAASQNSNFLAATSSDCRVHCWRLSSLIDAAKNGSSMPSPLTLSSYEAAVHCLAWDGDGRFMATSDCADCTVWDIAVGETRESDSVMCCGHDPGSHITSLDFQPDGPLLATVSDTGKLALFDSRGFRRGGVVGPYATVSVEATIPVSAACVVRWLPGGRLLLAIPGTGFILYSANLTLISDGSSDELQHAGAVCEADVSQVVTSVEYVSPPATPSNPPVIDSSDQTIDQATVSVSDQEPLPPQAPSSNQKDVPVLHSVEMPPIRTSPRMSPIEEGDAALAGPQQDVPPPLEGTSPEAANGSGTSSPGSNEYDSAGPGEGFLRERVRPPPLTTSRPRVPSSPAAKMDHHPRSALPGVEGSYQARRSAGNHPARSPHRASSGGWAPSLIDHIQQLREAPPSSRSDAQDNLTGWGSGHPGGAVPPGPWFPHMTPSAVGVANVSGQHPGGYMAVQYHPGYYMPGGYQQQQQQQQQFGRGVPPPRMGPGSHTSPSTTPPRGPSGMYTSIMPGTPQGSPFSPVSVRAEAGHREGGIPHASWQGMVPLGVMMPQQQQQQHVHQMQQWARTAPGYMAYQHTPYTGYAMPQGGGTYPVLPPPFVRNNVEVGSWKGVSPSDKDATDANNSIRRRRSSRSSTGGSETAPVSAETGPFSPRGSGDSADLTTVSSGEPSQVQQLPLPATIDKNPKAQPAAPPSPPIDGFMQADESELTVYVGNLPPAVDEYALMWTCAQFGPVTHVQIIRDKASQASRGYGFVTYAHPAYATLAMQQLNGQIMFGPAGGQRLKVAPTNKRLPGLGS